MSIVRTDNNSWLPPGNYMVTTHILRQMSQVPRRRSERAEPGQIIWTSIIAVGLVVLALVTVLAQNIWGNGDAGSWLYGWPTPLLLAAIVFAVLSLRDV